MKLSSILRQRKTRELQKPFPFFNLPPELRNKIYALALVNTESTIELTSGPALLQTSHQIRAEARALYYFSNDFHLTIHSCNPQPLINFTNTLSNLLQEQHPETRDQAISLTIDVDGTPNWRNLMHWCRFVYEKRETALVLRGGGGGNNVYLDVIAAALGIAVECECKSWEGTDMALRFFRSVAGLVDDRWMLN